MNTRNILRTALNALTALTALTALVGSAVAQGPVTKVPIGGGRVVGPVQKVPLPMALPDLQFVHITECGPWENWRDVTIINNGIAEAPTTTLFMTWTGFDADVSHFRFYPFVVKALAPGEQVTIHVDPGYGFWQYQSGSTVKFYLDYYHEVWETNEQNNMFIIENP